MQFLRGSQHPSQGHSSDALCLAAFRADTGKEGKKFGEMHDVFVKMADGGDDSYGQFLAFAAFAAFTVPLVQHGRGLAPSWVRGFGEYDVLNADIETFYHAFRIGQSGDPVKGTVVSECIVKLCYGDFTKQGVKHYAGCGKGLFRNIGKKDMAVIMESLKTQTVDETQKVVNNNQGWVWFAAEMSIVGPAMELCSVPYGKRVVLVVKQANVNELYFVMK
mmetsp:Transcript_17281/g.36092  ORF Transcript_17281/g.36092 Transcript_17281/m.36092 type:complete len:219 (+) Transcript_17281:100-756(+)